MFYTSHPFIFTTLTLILPHIHSAFHDIHISHTVIPVYIHRHFHTHLPTYTHSHIHIHTQTFTHVHTQADICAHVYLHTQTLHTLIHAHGYTHTHLRGHILTHIRRCAQLSNHSVASALWSFVYCLCQGVSVLIK